MLRKLIISCVALARDAVLHDTLIADYDGSVHRLPVEDLLAYRSVSVLSKDVSTLT